MPTMLDDLESSGFNFTKKTKNIYFVETILAWVHSDKMLFKIQYDL